MQLNYKVGISKKEVRDDSTVGIRNYLEIEEYKRPRTLNVQRQLKHDLEGRSGTLLLESLSENK